MIIGIIGLDIEIERVIIKNFRQFKYPVVTIYEDCKDNTHILKKVGCGKI